MREGCDGDGCVIMQMSSAKGLRQKRGSHVQETITSCGPSGLSVEKEKVGKGQDIKRLCLLL